MSQTPHLDKILRLSATTQPRDQHGRWVSSGRTKGQKPNWGDLSTKDLERFARRAGWSDRQIADSHGHWHEKNWWKSSTAANRQVAKEIHRAWAKGEIDLDTGTVFRARQRRLRKPLAGASVDRTVHNYVTRRQGTSAA